MYSLGFVPQHKNARVISLKIYVVLIGFLYLFSPANAATGPTAWGSIQISPTIVSPANQYSSIPVSVQVVLPDGTRDTSFTQTVTLGGATGSETTYFQDNFESSVSYSSGYICSGSTLSYDTTVVAANSSRSAKITGGVSNNLCGPYYEWSNTKPARFSAYMRSNSSTNGLIGPIVTMVEYDIGQYWTAANVLFDATVGRIRMRRCNGDCTYVYSTGVTYVPNQWYKIDVVINWTSSTVDLYVDDILRDSAFPLMYGSSTKTMCGIVYYNYGNGITGWVDNVKVINTEGNPVSVPVSPSSISITNGLWSGNVQVQSSTASNMYLSAKWTSGSFKEGRSNLFSTTTGCNPGQYSSSYYTACQTCNAGSFSNTTGASSCTQCSPGTYQGSSGQSSCINCGANTYNPNYGSTAISACLPCTYPQIANPGSANCSTCKPGEWFDAAASKCKGCPTGQYGIGGPTCFNCSAGTYNDMTNQSSCMTCPSGRTYTGTGATSASNCTACPAGQYAFNSTTCFDCGTGTYNNLTGQTSCFVCPAGTSNNMTAQQNFSACIPCPLGYHASSNGSTQCVPCDAGTHANTTGLANCYGCPPGSATNATGSVNCTACTPGYHAQNSGQDKCVPCDAGTFSNRTGESMCPPCGLGYFSSSAGLTECTKCLIGTFANETGTGNCYNCPNSYTTLLEGSDSLSDCVPKCGDGRLETGEFCDDGNHRNGDGCSSNCTIEAGWVCLNPGERCSQQDTGGGSAAGKQTTAIVAGVVGVFAFGVCGVGLVLGFFLYRRKTKENKQPPPVEMPAKVVDMEDGNYRRIPSMVMGHSPIIRSTLDSAEKIPQRLSHSNEIRYAELNTSESTVVGKGAFGIVFSAYWRGQKVAVKEIKNENISADDVQKFVEEAELMRNLKPHANVVLFMGVILDPFCIVTEFLEGGDLHSFLRSDSKIPFELQLSFMKDIARGMFHLSLEGIVHRDLAARNVLLNRDFTAKVSDFGLSRIADADNVIYSKSDIGPLKWMSPEAIRRKKYSEKSDVWAFGVTCWEILSREEPFKDMDAVQVATAVVGEGLRPEIPHWTPPRLSEIVMATWETDPDLRPTFHQLVSLLDTVEMPTQ